MTQSISRSLYKRFLLLYPEPFRHDFGDEILGIFEKCRRAQGLWRVLADIVLSAVKQQIHYRSTPLPKNVPFYSEIDPSPRLARILGGVALGAALVAGEHPNLLNPRR